MSKVIQYSKQNSNLSLISLSELEEKANLSANDQQLTHRSPKADDIAVLVYTSGIFKFYLFINICFIRSLMCF